MDCEFSESEGAIVATITDSITPDQLREMLKRTVNQFIRQAHEAGFTWETCILSIRMRSDMWAYVSKNYALNYGDIQINVSPQARERLEMFEKRMALLIQGRWYPVVIDDTIPEVTEEVVSDIYFLTDEG